MIKKEFITPIIIAALSLLFAAICLMVFISGGKSKIWIARKMKIGGILLSISAITTGTGCTMCYDAPGPDYVSFSGFNSYWIEIELDTGNVLHGAIAKPDSDQFSFSVTDTAGIKADKNKLIPDDGQFGSATENFSLEIKPDLPKGIYCLDIFDCDTASQTSSHPIQSFSLNIKK